MGNSNDKVKHIVMILDAGGINFIFSAIRENQPLIKPIQFEPYSNNLEKCLETIITGF